MSSAGQIIRIQGWSTDIDTTVEDLSVNGTNNAYLTQPAGVGLDIVSASAADDVGSTGVETVRLWYLDTDWQQQHEDISMNGTTTVSTTATDILRVQYMEAINVGSGGVAAGAITLTEDGGVVNTYLKIGAGSTFSENGYYYVPAGQKFLVRAIYPAVGAAMTGETRLELFVQTCADTTEANIDLDFVEREYVIGNTENVNIKPFCFDPPIIVQAKCRVRMRAVASAVDQTLMAQMAGVLVPATYIYRP